MNLNFKWLIFGILFTFLFYCLFSGEKEGDNPKIGKSLYLSVKNGKNYHIHHWMVHTVLFIPIIIAWPQKKMKEENILYSLLLGVAIGGVVQGLTYNDWNIV